MRRRVVAAAVAALLLAGCQGAEEPGTDTPTPTGASTSTEPAQPSTEEPSTDETSGDETSSDPPTGDQTDDDDDDDDDTSEDDPSGTSEPTADLPAWVDATETDEQEAGEQQDEGQEITGVRVGLHDDYDRVVLDLSGDDAVLGWVAFYEDEAVADGSGEPIEVAGSAVLQVSVRGIDWTTESDVRYDGTTVTGEGLEVVTEVVFGTLFEGQQQVFLGVEEQTPYRVFTLDDPARIVVDVQHP